MTSSNGNISRVTGHLCGEFTGPGEFPAQWPVTQSFNVLFDLRLNKRSWGWWFEALSWSLWRQCNIIFVFFFFSFVCFFCLFCFCFVLFCAFFTLFYFGFFVVVFVLVFFLWPVAYFYYQFPSWRLQNTATTTKPRNALRWRHNEHDSVSNHQPHDCLLNADQGKHQSTASLAFVRRIHREPVNSPHKWPVRRKMFPFVNVIMEVRTHWCRDEINAISQTTFSNAFS